MQVKVVAYYRGIVRVEKARIYHVPEEKAEQLIIKLTKAGYAASIRR